MKICGRIPGADDLATLTIANGRIARIQQGEHSPDIGGSDVWLSAGFCDLQVNGFGGYDFNVGMWGDGSEAAADPSPLLDLLFRSGTATFCPTITTNSFSMMASRLQALSRALNSDSRLARAVAGIHVEGPYISSQDGPRGAHPLEFVRDPDWDEFSRLQDAAGGRIKILTLAPERTGALAFIEKLAAFGVTVALGHTAAEPEVIRSAVAAGARLSTHLGNGSHDMIRRHPNYIWEQLACDDLCASVIADTYHLPASVLKVFARAKGPERLAIISDAVSLGGLPPGRYSNGRHEVLPSGKIVLAGTPYLAGSGHLLDAGIANAVRSTDLSLEQAIGCVTAVPARLLDLQDRKGRLCEGYDADLTLFRVRKDGPLEIGATICGGELVYSG